MASPVVETSRADFDEAAITCIDLRRRDPTCLRSDGAKSVPASWIKALAGGVDFPIVTETSGRVPEVIGTRLYLGKSFAAGSWSVRCYNIRLPKATVR